MIAGADARPAGPASCGPCTRAWPARTAEHMPDYVWLTDADIAHAPDTLRRAGGAAPKREGLVLTSLMAKLRCKSSPSGA